MRVSNPVGPTPRSALTHTWGEVAHHDGSQLYVSHPYPQIGDHVRVRVRVQSCLEVRAVHLRCTPDGDQQFVACRLETTAESQGWWAADLVMTNQELRYRFVLATSQGGLWVTATGIHAHEVPDAGDFRLTTDPAPPAWAAAAVFYEVFLDRFARGDRTEGVPVPDWAVAADWDDPVMHLRPEGVRQLYGGDLWGVTEHLDHLTELGVTALYLTPFFPAGSNHRYDATSFDRVDPLLGGDPALRQLITRAGEHDIRVIGDLTLNHTGAGHDWFRRACDEPSSTEAGFYLFQEHPHSYETFAGVSSLPKLDHRDPELRSRLFEGGGSVAARYLREFGLAGWRIDVAQSAGHCGASNRTLDTARSIRATLAADGQDGFVVAEHMFDASQTLAGDAWHGAMAYAAFTRPVWSWLGGGDIDRHWGVPTSHARYTGKDMAATMDSFNALIPWRSRIHSLNLLDSHDTPRLRSIVGAGLFAVATGLLLTMPGIPMLFAGDEIGTEGANLEDGRRPFRWDRSTWDLTTYQWHRRLLALHTDHPAFTVGGFRWLHTGRDVVVYERSCPTETIIVQASRADHDPIFCPEGARDLLGEHHLPDSGGHLPHAGPAFGVWVTTATTPTI